MTQQERLKAYEKILLAAASLEDTGKRDFSGEDLAVAAWRLFPDTFGLAGHLDERGIPLYPNSNRVYMEIMGAKPVRRLGLLAASGTKVFRLTELGRQQARMLQERGGGRGPAKISLSREVVRELRLLLATRAVAKLTTGRAEAITFHDASSFWGINPRSRAKELQARIAHIESLLRLASDAAREGSFVFNHGGTAYDEAVLRSISELHEFMLERFKGDLDVIRKRIDDRL